MNGQTWFNRKWKVTAAFFIFGTLSMALFQNCSKYQSIISQSTLAEFSPEGSPDFNNHPNDTTPVDAPPHVGEPGGDVILREAIIAPVDTSVLTLVPDFERMQGSLRGNLLTLSRSPTAADIGKVVAIKKARMFRAFKEATISWNGYVTGISSGKLIVSQNFGTLNYGDPDAERTDVNATEVLIGTNHYDTIQEAMDKLVSRGQKKLKLNFKGTIYVVPALSSLARTASRFYKGWMIGGSQPVTLSGNGKNLTRIKFGSEDNATTGDWRSEIFNFHALNNSTHVEVQDMTWESADRVSTIMRTGVGGFQGVGTNPRGVTLRRFRLASPDIKFGWDIGVQETNIYGDGYGFGSQKLKVAVIESEIEAGNPVVIFSQAGAFKKYVARNVGIVGGGKAVWQLPLMNTVQLELKNGLTQITVHDPSFSLYEMASYDEWWNYRPRAQLHPKAEFTAQVSLVNGETRVELPPACFDGRPHGVKLVYGAGVDPNAIPLNYIARSTNGNLYIRMQNDVGALVGSEVRRLVETQLPHTFRFLSDRNEFTIEYPFSGFLREGLSRNVATLVTNPDAYAPISPAEMDFYQGGSIVIMGKRAAEGHAHYIHPNVELDINGMRIASHLRTGMRYGSDSGVPGQHSTVRIKNWFESKVGGIPYFFYERFVVGGVQLHGDNFTGTAQLGSSVYEYNYDIALPNENIPD